jgi:hypothetical protein
MRGLGGVLPRFSDGLRVRKILPSLLEEVRARVSLSSLLFPLKSTMCVL